MRREHAVPFDAVLYLVPTPWTMTLIPKSLCEDPAYVKMRLARLAIATGRPRPTSPVGSFEKICADLTR